MTVLSLFIVLKCMYGKKARHLRDSDNNFCIATSLCCGFSVVMDRINLWNTQNNND